MKSRARIAIALFLPVVFCCGLHAAAPVKGKPNFMQKLFPLKPAKQPASAQTDEIPHVLTLKAAEAYALAHHPDIKAALYKADAAKQGVVESRADFFPQLTGIAVFAEANNNGDARIAAYNGLSNPTILTREANGLYLTQLITDFGKTALLTSRAILTAKSANERIDAIRQLVLLNVDKAYFGALGAEALVRLTDQEVSTNQLLYDRIKALSASNLKSTLDVSLQQANLAQARLLQVNAQGRFQEAMAELAAALGSRADADFTLSHEDSLATVPESVQPLLSEAMAQRPDIISLRYSRDAAFRAASAAGAARLPNITGIAAGGLTPYHEQTLPDNYGMVGVNVSVPLFTGGKLSAQQKELQFQAKAFEQFLENQEIVALRDVRDAWIDARTSYKKIQVSKEFLEASSTAFELAQSLYVAGTSSIVEVSQSDLQRIEAQIAYINAKYEYQTKLSVMAYETGNLK
ncbi:MAG: TolC family protein [Chthoniobacterales bacterium]